MIPYYSNMEALVHGGKIDEKNAAIDNKTFLRSAYS